MSECALAQWASIACYVTALHRGRYVGPMYVLPASSGCHLYCTRQKFPFSSAELAHCWCLLYQICTFQNNVFSSTQTITNETESACKQDRKHEHFPACKQILAGAALGLLALDSVQGLTFPQKSPGSGPVSSREELRRGDLPNIRSKTLAYQLSWA